MQGVSEKKLKEEKERLEKEMNEKQRQQQEMIQEKLKEQKKQSEEDSRWLEEEESKSEFPGLLSPVGSTSLVWLFFREIYQSRIIYRVFLCIPNFLET